MCTHPYFQMKQSKPYLSAETKPQPEIFICDLDGCLWEQLFPSLQGELMLAEEREQLVSDLNQRLKSVAPYPNFLEYFEECNPHKIIFVTGRKEKDFGQITEYQLKPLKEDKSYTHPMYFPPDAEHTKRIYRNFKIYAITDLIRTLTKQYSNSLIKIFDDDKAYFEVLHLFFECGYEGPLKIHFKTYWMQSNEDWEDPEKRVFNMTRRGYT